jgi:nicotinate-nucleotide adenylyltransferase
VVGLLGGAFDPPHNGHVTLAREAVERFGLERLLVLVVAAPGHKPVETSLEHRLALARAAFDDVPRAEVVADEHAFTVDSLRDGCYNPGETVFFVGADEFADFLTWRDPDGVLEHVRLAVATRPGYPRAGLEDVLARLARPDRVEFFEIPAVAASSREIRGRVARGEVIDGLMPPRVARLVVELGLYHGR